MVKQEIRNLWRSKSQRGKIHEYLGMIMDFSQPGKVIIDMIDYVASMIDECSIEFDKGKTSPTPAGEDLFAQSDSEKLDKKRGEEFHHIVAKGIFVCKRARPDIHLTIGVLCKRVKNPNEDDWNKLLRLLAYLNGTRKDKLILSADNLHVIKWYVDAAFAVHPILKATLEVL